MFLNIFSSLVCLYVFAHTVVGCTVRTTVFRIVHNGNSGNHAITCAYRIHLQSFDGTRLHATTGECTGVNLQSDQDRQYEEGYEYMEKRSHQVIHTTPSVHNLSRKTNMFLPFNITGDTKVEIVFTLYDNTDELVEVDLVDTLDLHFRFDDDIPENIPVRVRALRDASTFFVRSFNGTLKTHAIISPFQLDVGTQHKLVIKTMEIGDVKVEVDGISIIRYTPTVVPGDARMLRVMGYDVSIHKIVFRKL